MTMSVFWFHLIFEYKSSGGSIFCSLSTQMYLY